MKDSKAKQQAIELVNLFKDNVNPYIGSGMLSNSQDNGAIVWQSKMVATKCVEQIIEALKTTTGHLELNPIENHEVCNDFEHWKSIIQAIDDLKTTDIFTNQSPQS